MTSSQGARDLAQDANYDLAPHEDLGDMKALTQIRNKRQTTDCFCTLIFMAFSIGFGAVVYFSMQRGDPRRLYHGFDYKGNLCGVSPNVSGMPLMYWPKPEKMKYPICVGHCPDSEFEQVLFPQESVRAVIVEGDKRVITIVQEHVKINTYPSKMMAGRFCLPIADGSHHGAFVNFTASLIHEDDKSAMTRISNGFQDISHGWAVLVFMLPFSIFMGYLFLFWLKYCAKILTWTIIFSLIFGFAALSYYLVVVIGHNETRAEELLGPYTEKPAQTVKVMGYVSCGITVCLLICLFGIWKTITSILGVVEASCDAIWAMPFLLPLPILDI